MIKTLKPNTFEQYLATMGVIIYIALFVVPVILWFELFQKKEYEGDE